MKNPRSQAAFGSFAFALTLALATGAVTVVAGCGGGGSTSTTAAAVNRSSGRATITIRWPQRGSTKLIPIDANSVRVSFLSGTTVLQSQVVSRPSNNGGGGGGDNSGNAPSPSPLPPPIDSTVSFIDLPQGAVTVTATAYPTYDATGTAQAGATGNFTITAGQDNPIGLSMDSTIDHVDILPQDIPFTTDPVDLTAVAYDAQNNLVLTSQWTWKNSDSEVISLVASGDKATIQIVGVGESIITLTETQTGKTAQKKIDVAPGS